MSFFRGFLVLLCAALPLSLVAFVPKQVADKDLLVIEPPRVAARSQTVRSSELSPSGAAARAFLKRYGGEWAFGVDPRTSRFDRIQGSGVPLIPGQGNSLGPQSLQGLDMSDGRITLATLEPSVRAFIDANAELLRPVRGELVLNGALSQMRLDGRLISLKFDWIVDGVPVENAGVYVRVNHGNITQFGAPLVGPIELDTTPLLDAEQAIAKLMGYTGDAEVARIQGDPQLAIQPEVNLMSAQGT